MVHNKKNMKINKRYRKSVLSKQFNELLSRGAIGYLITNKRHVKSILGKKFVEILSIGPIVYFLILIFVSQFSSFTTGIGTLSQIDEVWYICYENSNYHPIYNPKDFPHILIPENDGNEVHYVAYIYGPNLCTIGFYVYPSYIVFLDTIEVFTIKQNLIFAFVGIISSAILIYLIYLICNHKNFVIINTIKKQKFKPVVKKTFNNLIYANHFM